MHGYRPIQFFFCCLFKNIISLFILIYLLLILQYKDLCGVLCVRAYVERENKLRRMEDDVNLLLVVMTQNRMKGVKNCQKSLKLLWARKVRVICGECFRLPHLSRTILPVQFSLCIFFCCVNFGTMLKSSHTPYPKAGTVHKKSNCSFCLRFCSCNANSSSFCNTSNLAHIKEETTQSWIGRVKKIKTMNYIHCRYRIWDGMIHSGFLCTEFTQPSKNAYHFLVHFASILCNRILNLYFACYCVMCIVSQSIKSKWSRFASETSIVIE